uniref:Uncharacterized protein n=1 Tax=Solanum tuberosum TaxID=4113 RepID=M1D759_SOLTU
MQNFYFKFLHQNSKTRHQKLKIVKSRRPEHEEYSSWNKIKRSRRKKLTQKVRLEL